MSYYWLFSFFILGAIIGSFLNVVIYRLHTGRSLEGRSHCLSCGKMLSWYELVPIVSYLAIRARCLGCSSWIPPRYFFVEVGTGILFVLAWQHAAGDMVQFAFEAVVMALLMLILVYDMRHTIIPNELVIVLFTVAALFLGYHYVMTRDFSMIIEHVLGAVGAFAFFWSLWAVSKGRWIGLGDAKLAAPLALMLAPLGALSMVVFGFWIGAAIGICLMLIERILKQGTRSLSFIGAPITIKSEIPFAPFLIAGFLITYLYNVDLFYVTNFFIW